MTDLLTHQQTPQLRTQSICYVGPISPDSTSEYRVRAFRRLCETVDIFDVRSYDLRLPKLNHLRLLYPVGPLVSRINRDLIKYVKLNRPKIIIFDKPIYFRPETIREIQAFGAKVVFYMQDNPFGPRNDGIWMQFLRAYPLADLHCTFRGKDVERYTNFGLPFVQLMFSYEPSVHFPAPPDWVNSNAHQGITYIGTALEDRPRFLVDLSETYSLPVSISGERWTKCLTESQQKELYTGGPLLGARYREAIWKSSINLSFVTELNEDDIAHKSIEIAASGGFLLALRTPGHQATFDEDREAVFFSSIEECVDKARYYLKNERERKNIAHRGYLRAIRSGYSNDAQLSKIVKYFD